MYPGISKPEGPLTELELYDILADLTAQAYFVARELNPDRPTETWRELVYYIIEQLAPEEVEFLNSGHADWVEAIKS